MGSLQGCLLNINMVWLCFFTTALLLPVATVKGEDRGGRLHNSVLSERSAQENNIPGVEGSHSGFVNKISLVKRDLRQRRNVQTTAGYQRAPTTGIPRPTSRFNSPGVTLVFRPGVTTGLGRRLTTRPGQGFGPNIPISRGFTNRWAPPLTNPPRFGTLAPRPPNEVDPVPGDGKSKSSEQQTAERNRNIIIGAVSGGVFLLVLVFIGVALIIIARRKKRSENNEENDIKMAPVIPPRVSTRSLEGKDDSPHYQNTKGSRKPSNTFYEEM